MSNFQRQFAEAKELVGGRYRLTALIQKRIRELVHGERPLVECATRDYVEIALAEILAGKIEMGAEIHDPEDTEIVDGSVRPRGLELEQSDDADPMPLQF